MRRATCLENADQLKDYWKFEVHNLNFKTKYFLKHKRVNSKCNLKSLFVFTDIFTLECNLLEVSKVQ